jgi:hypothetical protein
MSNKSKCEFCGKEYYNLYKCKFCGKELCPDHRLRENHHCASLANEPYFSGLKRQNGEIDYEEIKVTPIKKVVYDKFDNLKKYKTFEDEKPAKTITKFENSKIIYRKKANPYKIKYHKPKKEPVDFNYSFKKVYKQSGFLTKIFKYGILYFLLLIIAKLFGITDYYWQIIFIGTMISLFSRAISSYIFNYKFKFNFNLFIWTLVYILLLFFIKYIINSVTGKFVYEIIFVAIAYTFFIHLAKKVEYYSLCAVVILITLIFGFILAFGIYSDNPNSTISGENVDIKSRIINSVIIKECSDGTDYNFCSTNKPFYCLDGNLIEKPETCGCAYEFVWVLNKCVSIYETNPKEIDLNYTLRGKKGSVDYTVYRGLNDYLANLERAVWYTSGQTPPTDEQMSLRYITEKHQSKYISPLVDKIKQLTDNSDDQARIAISIVQTMSYDWDSFSNFSATGRYPYETLYDQTGVCGDKSKLLVLMLKELGYGVVLFSFNIESHEAVGIKCPIEYSYKNSGYCFIESTTPSIITDSDGDYVNTGKLTSAPAIYTVSSGKSMDSVIEEYNDYNRYKELKTKLDSYGENQRLSESKYRQWKKDYDEWQALTKKYGFRFKE